jgi:Fe-S cluster biogenesis protein NfuA
MNFMSLPASSANPCSRSNYSIIPAIMLSCPITRLLFFAIVDACAAPTYTHHVSMMMDINLSQAPQTPQATLHQRVQEVLDTLRPMIQWDGGDVELLGVSDGGVVSVRFHGACVGCPSSQATLRQGLEKNIRERIAEITAVISEDEVPNPPPADPA